METTRLSKVPILYPSQFDEYIFQNWKPNVHGFYEEFHIARIENYKQHLKLPLPPHRRSVYFFIFISKGKVIRSKGLTNYAVLPNHFFFLPANQITSLEYVSPDAEGFYCHFFPEIFNHRWLKTSVSVDFSFFQLTGNPLVQVNNPQRQLQLLDILENEYQNNTKERFGLISIYLLSLFSEVSLQADSGRIHNNAATLLTQRYKNALSELIYEKKTVSEFANYLSVTTNHLHKCVKATTGKSAHQLLDEMRLLEAKVLLQQTALSVGEIAFKIGQFDPSDFSRFFKSKTSMTPQQYRQSQS